MNASSSPMRKSTASSSKWFVGSSNTMASTGRRSRVANAKRRRWPPLISPSGVESGTFAKPRPASTVAIRASNSHRPEFSARANARSNSSATVVFSGSAAIRSLKVAMSDSMARSSATAASISICAGSENGRDVSWAMNPVTGGVINTPASGVSSPEITPSRVDLPAPFSPISPVTEPDGTAKLMSVSTRWPPG